MAIFAGCFLFYSLVTSQLWLISEKLSGVTQLERADTGAAMQLRSEAIRRRKKQTRSEILLTLESDAVDDIHP